MIAAKPGCSNPPVSDDPQQRAQLQLPDPFEILEWQTRRGSHVRQVLVDLRWNAIADIDPHGMLARCRNQIARAIASNAGDCSEQDIGVNGHRKDAEEARRGEPPAVREREVLGMLELAIARPSTRAKCPRRCRHRRFESGSRWRRNQVASVDDRRTAARPWPQTGGTDRASPWDHR